MVGITGTSHSSSAIESVIPSWAPNVHPLIVHFPIVLIVLALAVDIYRVFRPRILSGVVEWLYVLTTLAAGAAYVSGRVAADNVFVPGMAHPIMESHGTWSLVTVFSLLILAGLRVTLFWRSGPDHHLTRRLLFVVLGGMVGFLMVQTAEQGARLVFEQGVGVIPGPVPSSIEVTPPNQP